VSGENHRVDFRSIPSRGRDPGLALAYTDVQGRRHRIALDRPDFTIGRSHRCSLTLDFGEVSRTHCRLVLQAGVWSLQDENSKNGTLLNGEPVPPGERRTVRLGDVIAVGEEGRIQLAVEARNPMGALIDDAVSRSLEGNADPAVLKYQTLLPSILRALSSTLDLEDVLGMMLDALLRLTNTSRGVILLEEGGRLVPRGQRTLGRGESADAEIPQTVVERVCRTARAVVLPAMTSGDLTESMRGQRLQAVYCFPLRSFEGNRMGNWQSTVEPATLGAVYADGTQEGTPLLADDVTFVQTLCDLAAIHVSNARLYERATHDGLTGLQNRSTFENHLDDLVERARATGSPLSLALLDLDMFKSVNDTHGYNAGDTVIRHAATVLREAVGTLGLPCRYGGEEFAVAFPDVDSPGALELVDAARRELGRAPVLHERDGVRLEIPVTLSAGIVTVPCEGMVRRLEIVEAATKMLHACKRGGRNRVATWPDGVLASD
jgi:diguanylate cyclase (GGDEF)-like protein